MPSRNPRIPREPLFELRKSELHGSGCFATTNISKGGWVAEYTGELISSEKADQRQKRRDHSHTVLYHISETEVIDGKHGNNGTAYLNHSCKPNMQAIQLGKKIFFQAIRDIKVGEELTFDYGLTNVRPEQLLKGHFICKCGAKRCSGWLNARVPLRIALKGSDPLLIQA